MKKALIIIAGILVVLLGAAFILPVVFKDDIKAKVDSEIAKSVNADVYFEADKFNLSLFRHFPNITVGLDDFGVVGRAPFKGDTLVSAKSFEVIVNLMSVIAGDKIKVNGIYLDSPRIQAKVLKDGKANWDIYIPSTDTTAAVDTSKSEFSVGIKEWEIKDGYVVYDDKTMPMYAQLVNLNHKGSGDFTQDIFDLATNTTIDQMTVSYDGTEYLSKKKLDADMTLSMDMPNSKYTFKDNTVKLNDFALGFDGFVAMPDTNINMDITYKAKESDFKTLLSIVPGAYTESFKDVKAEGKVAFDGLVKGTYNGRQLPGFALNLLVTDAMFKYASLPTAVNNINVDMKVVNKDGVIDNTLVDIKKFNMDLGKNPVNGRVLIDGLTKMNVDANVLAKINLAELTQMFPIDGLALKGLYSLDLKAKGIYDTITHQIPTIDAKMNLQNGYVKSKDFPAPLEQMNVIAQITNATGKMVDTKINVSDFRMLLEGEPFSATAFVENLDDYTYDVKVKGTIDLTKITKIYPIEGMTLAGKIAANIETKGKMSDVTAERYDQLPTSGTMSMSNFSYVTKDMPPVKITTASMNFTPQQINITDYKGYLGKSDVAITGSVSNYIAYLFKENATIRGNMNFTSSNFDVNEWMTEDPNASKAPEEPLTVVEVPKTIDFVLASSIGEVNYDNMKLSNLKGNIIVRDGAVRMDQVAFNAMGGSIVTNGVYDTKDIKNPLFNFDLNMANVAIPQVYKSFNTVQALMPLAQNMNGNVSTNFKIAGGLGQDMMPVYSTLTGGGLIKIAEAMIQDAPVLQKLLAVTKLSNLSPMALKDILLQAEVKDGRISFKPFDVKVAGYTMNVAGSNGFTGEMDYKVKMDVPAGALGTAVNSALSSLTGKPAANSQNIKLDLNVGGTYKAPKIGLAGSSATEGAKDAVTATVKGEVDKVKAEADKRRAEAEAKARAKADSVKAATEAKIKAEGDKLKAEAEKQKKAAEEAAKKRVEEEKKKLKDRFSGFGKPKTDTTKKQ